MASNESTTATLPFQKSIESAKKYFETELANAQAELIQMEEGFGDDFKRFSLTSNAGEFPDDCNLSVAILSVTEAISRKGEVKFALYNPDELSRALQGIAQQASEDFLNVELHRPDCPIYIPFIKQPMEGEMIHHDSQGHYILAAAHTDRGDDERNDCVQLDFYDSSPHFYADQHGEIQDHTQRLLETVWKSGRRIRCRFTWMPVFQQNNRLGCGIHLILNSWMLAMGLEPCQRVSPLGPTFYRSADELIKCVVHGVLHCNAILAFLYTWNLLKVPFEEPPQERRFGKTPGRFTTAMVANDLLNRRLTSPPRPTSPAVDSSTAGVPSLPREDQRSNNQPGPGRPQHLTGSNNDDDDDDDNSKEKTNTRNGNGDQDRSTNQISSGRWTPAWWPQMAEKYPREFLSKRTEQLAERPESGVVLQDLRSQGWLTVFSLRMVCASIASITEAISLNGYQKDTYLSEWIDVSKQETKMYDSKVFHEPFFIKSAQAGTTYDVELLKDQRNDQRVGKKVFSFYQSQLLQETLEGPDSNHEVHIARPKEPIFIPIAPFHLVYATQRRINKRTVVNMTHYWMGNRLNPGMPPWESRVLYENQAKQVLLTTMRWWPLDEQADSDVIDHTWMPMTPIDPLLTLHSWNQEAELGTIHLILTAWTLALGYTPPSTATPTRNHGNLYRVASGILIQAPYGILDAATIFFLLLRLGWIPPNAPPPPESRRFNRTARLATAEHQAAHLVWLTQSESQILRGDRERLNRESEEPEEVPPVLSGREDEAELRQVHTGLNEALREGDVNRAARMTKHVADYWKGIDTSLGVGRAMAFGAADGQANATTPTPGQAQGRRMTREGLVVDVESEVYDEMEQLAEGTGLHTANPTELARLFEAPPPNPGAQNMKRKMVDAAELRFKLQRRSRDTIT